MASTIAQKQGEPMINSREKDTMQRIVLCLSARVHALQALSAIDTLINSTAGRRTRCNELFCACRRECTHCRRCRPSTHSSTQQQGEGHDATNCSVPVGASARIA